MSHEKLRVVQYLNQFFGQEGGEEKADIKFLAKEGPIGPGIGLNKSLEGKAEVVATVICGDNYFAENIDKATEEGIDLIAAYAPDLFFAGPAFEAGRYGVSCGAICKIVQERLGIPAITAMFEENPGVDLYRRHVYICRTGRSAGKMMEDLTHMANLALKLISKEKGSRLISGENIGRPSDDGYFPREMLRNEYTEKTSAERGVEMLLAKIRGESFQTEAEGPKLQAIEPPPPIKDIAASEIALLSDGGLAPKGNPDGFRTRGNEAWGTYEVASLFPEGSPPVDHEIVHTGYSIVYVMDDPNRLMPVDVMHDLETEGIIGKFHNTLYSTSGNATLQARCREMGEEIVEQLKEKGVDGAILTST